MRFISRLVLLAPLYSCSSTVDKTDIKETPSPKKPIQETIANDEIPTFLIYGEVASVGYLDSKNEITEAYGFRLERIGGCLVDDLEIKRANDVNTKALKFMNAKYGKDWRKKFEEKTTYKLAIPFDD
jgi:hypothetical protein